MERSIPARRESQPGASHDSGVPRTSTEHYDEIMNREVARQTRREIVRLAHAGLDWVTFASRTAEQLDRVIPFEKACWHPVDPGTLLFTGSFTQNMDCSGPFLAKHEYVLEDVNKHAFLAGSGYRAGSLYQATHGDLSLSARFRAARDMGDAFADELRGSFVVDGTYWGAASLIREQGRPRFNGDEVRLLASLSSPIAEGFRRAILISSVLVADDSDEAPGLVILDEQGNIESISPAAQRWLDEIVEVPATGRPQQSHVLQVVAARARRAGERADGTQLPAETRARTHSGRWLLAYGMRLSGSLEGRTGVIIRPASAHDIAPLILDAYGLSERERQVTRLCLTGLPTSEIAVALNISPYTVQDHLKSIFDKTGTRSRGELVGRIFLEGYFRGFDEFDRSEKGLATSPAKGRAEARKN